MRAILLIPLFILTSCAGYVRTQSTKMISPEAHGGLGKGQIDVRVEAQARDRFNFANDSTNDPVEYQSSVYAVAPIGEVGIFKYLDVFLQPHIASPTVYGAKYQVVGDPRAKAKKGNLSASVLVGYGEGYSSYSGGTELEDFFNEDIRKLAFTQQHQEAGLIVGYRWSDKFLHYANAIYQQDTVDGKVSKDTGPLQDANFDYRQDGMIYSSGFIVYFAKAQFKVDYSHAIADWSKTRKNSVNSVSTSLGFNW